MKGLQDCVKALAWGCCETIENFKWGCDCLYFSGQANVAAVKIYGDGNKNRGSRPSQG